MNRMSRRCIFPSPKASTANFECAITEFAEHVDNVLATLSVIHSLDEKFQNMTLRSDKQMYIDIMKNHLCLLEADLKEVKYCAHVTDDDKLVAWICHAKGKAEMLSRQEKVAEVLEKVADLEEHIAEAKQCHLSRIESFDS